MLGRRSSRMSARCRQPPSPCRRRSARSSTTVIYIPQPTPSFDRTVIDRRPPFVVAILLLLGGVESNPGPQATAAADKSTTPFGLLNARFAGHKAALIHDVIADHRLDVLALTET